MRMDAESETLIAHALRADGFDASEDGTGRGTPLVPVSFDNRAGATNDAAITLRSSCHGALPMIAFSCKDHGADAGEVSPTLRSMEFDGSHANGGGQVAVALPILEPGSRTGKSTDDRRCSDGIGQDGDPMFTLQGSRTHGVAFQEAQTGCREYDTAGTLRSDGPGHDPVGTRVRSGMAVRRLTPMECERLQGFPDDWTAITYRGKPAADGPRYKALGNSMAVPVMRWILQRIQFVDSVLKAENR